MRNELPETCLSVLRSTGELVVIQRGAAGHHHSDWDTGHRVQNQELAEIIL